MLHTKTAEYIDKNRLIQPEERLAVAFSGGPDSVALLSILRDLNFPAAAIYINHQLREEESAKEEAFVRKFCAERNIELHIEHLKWKKRPSNLEEEARKRRYRHFAKIAQEFNFHKIALAHHKDDVAETILLRLIRGAGPAGLVPLRPQRGIYIRPLLEITRVEIMEYLREKSLPFFTDTSNLSTVHQRNRVRLELIPFIEKNFNLQFKNAIVRTSNWIEEQNRLLEELIEPVINRMLKTHDDHLNLDRNQFFTLSAPMQKAILRAAIGRSDPSLKLSSAQLDRLLSAVHSGTGLELPGFLVVQFTTDSISFRVKQSTHGLSEVDVPGVGSYLFPPAKVKLQFSLMKNEDLHLSPNVAHVDAEKTHFPLLIRNWKKGDSFQPLGMSGHKKLSDYWIDRKVPRSKRKTIPLVFQGDRLVWIAGYTIDEQFKVTPQTRSVMKIEMISTHV